MRSALREWKVVKSLLRGTLRQAKLLRKGIGAPVAKLWTVKYSNIFKQWIALKQDVNICSCRDWNAGRKGGLSSYCSPISLDSALHYYTQPSYPTLHSGMQLQIFFTTLTMDGWCTFMWSPTCHLHPAWDAGAISGGPTESQTTRSRIGRKQQFRL